MGGSRVLHRESEGTISVLFFPFFFCAIYYGMGGGITSLTLLASGTGFWVRDEEGWNCFMGNQLWRAAELRLCFIILLQRETMGRGPGVFDLKT